MYQLFTRKFSHKNYAVQELSHNQMLEWCTKVSAIAFKKVLVHKILLMSLLLTNFIPISLQELSYKHLYYYLQDHSCIAFIVCHIFLISISNRNNMRNSPFPEPCDIWWTFGSKIQIFDQSPPLQPELCITDKRLISVLCVHRMSTWKGSVSFSHSKDWNWKVTKSQDLPKFQFSGGGRYSEFQNRGIL